MLNEYKESRRQSSQVSGQIWSGEICNKPKSYSSKPAQLFDQRFFERFFEVSRFEIFRISFISVSALTESLCTYLAERQQKTRKFNEKPKAVKNQWTKIHRNRAVLTNFNCKELKL